VPRTLVQFMAMCHLQDTFQAARLCVVRNNYKRYFCRKHNSDSKCSGGYKMSKVVARVSFGGFFAWLVDC